MALCFATPPVDVITTAVTVLGLSKTTFEAAVAGVTDPDYTAFDRVMPHPVYGTQHWVCILNPSDATFDKIVKPLLDEAHERVARGYRKVAAEQASRD